MWGWQVSRRREGSKGGLNTQLHAHTAADGARQSPSLPRASVSTPVQLLSSPLGRGITAGTVEMLFSHHSLIVFERCSRFLPACTARTGL